MNKNSSDPLVSVSEAAVCLGVKERRVQAILMRNLIGSVRTVEGIKYRLDDVIAVKKMNS
jgi:hypothetical protein